jgi:chemotaxis protein CheX
MQPNQIMPFIEATKNVFSTMLKMKVTFGTPVQQREPDPKYDVSGIIGLSGELSGVIVLTFPTETALKCVEAFAGMKVEPDSESFADALGELTNMVSGAAKARIKGFDLSISCPSVVMGQGHTVRQISDAECIYIPCETEVGDFFVAVCIRDASAQQAAA